MFSNDSAYLGAVLHSFEKRSLDELIVSMEVAGWRWQQLPRKMVDRAALQYRHGVDIKLWYSAGHSRISKQDLQCFLNAGFLYEEYGIDWIPHAAPGTVYEDILLGNRPPPLADLAAPRMELEDDIRRPRLAIGAPAARRGRVRQPAALEDGEVGDESELEDLEHGDSCCCYCCCCCWLVVLRVLAVLQ